MQTKSMEHIAVSFHLVEFSNGMRRPITLVVVYVATAAPLFGIAEIQWGHKPAKDHNHATHQETPRATSSLRPPR